MSKDMIIFGYEDPSNHERYCRVIDTGERVRVESSIPLEEGARILFDSLANIFDANERNMLSKLRAFKRKQNIEIV